MARTVVLLLLVPASKRRPISMAARLSAPSTRLMPRALGTRTLRRASCAPDTRESCGGGRRAARRARAAGLETPITRLRREVERLVQRDPSAPALLDHATAGAPASTACRSLFQIDNAVTVRFVS